MVILCFFGGTGGILEMQELVPRHFLFINSYMHVSPCSWALGICENIGVRTYFGTVTVESVEVSCNFAFWRHEFKLATFLIAHKDCIL